MSSSISITNRSGHDLSARLDLPVGGEPKHFALFAHCFTCSKDLRAVRNISRSLTEQGFGVLRFDFTGLGESEGDFAESNFSSNLSDLEDACNWLSEFHMAPSLLIGHSLGGAAVLISAQNLPDIEAVVTIGAPASVSHVSHLIMDSQEEIEKKGEAKVEIAGRPFTIKKQFLEDLEMFNLTDLLKSRDLAYLFMHSPQDNTVEIANAAQLYEAVRHPKSFISLDGADHLLTNSNDSNYVGNVIGSWAKRYLTDPLEQKKPEVEHQVHARIGRDGYTTEIIAAGHPLIADEPRDIGGNDLGPNPYALVSAGLAACTGITLTMYAQRKNWPVEEIEISVDHDKDYVKDCETCEESEVKIDVFRRKIKIHGELDEKQTQRMLTIADKCPVHRTLEGSSKVLTTFVP